MKPYRGLLSYQLVRAQDNNYRIKRIADFVLPDGRRFGSLDVTNITAGNIKAFAHARNAAGLSAVTVNHDLKLLRKMFNWGIVERRIERSPFKIGTQTIIKLEKETPREFRFARSIEDEERILALADARMRAFITTMLDTCCRPGELRRLQWRDVDLERRVIKLAAAGSGRTAQTKTKVGRTLPLSSRVVALLQMRQHLPDGQKMPGDRFVFGNELGEQMSKDALRNAWPRLPEKAGIRTADGGHVHLADLRHEAGSRYADADVPLAHVSKMLGHANLTTTTRYLNVTEEALRRAVDKLDFARSLQGAEKATPESEQPATQAVPSKTLLSIS